MSIVKDFFKEPMLWWSLGLAFLVLLLPAILPSLYGSNGINWFADTGGGSSTYTNSVVTPTVKQVTFSSPPEFKLEDGVDYYAIINTNLGEIKIDLFEKDMPTTVNNFVFLANHGFYNGLKWYKVSPDVLIQTGDIYNSGTGTAGYTLPVEFSPNVPELGPGTVAMFPINGFFSSQFVIFASGVEDHISPVTLKEWKQVYPIFGKVDYGMDVVDKISKLPKDQEAFIIKIDIVRE